MAKNEQQSGQNYTGPARMGGWQETLDALAEVGKWNDQMSRIGLKNEPITNSPSQPTWAPLDEELTTEQVVEIARRHGLGPKAKRH
jgi:hypothetical protein